MPIGGDDIYKDHWKPKTWKTMARWERKNWYRNNQFNLKAKKP